MSVKDEHDPHSGIVHPAIALLVESTRAVEQLATRTTQAGARVLLPSSVAEPANHMLTSLRTMVEQGPHLTDEIDVLMRELHAKRLSIRAVVAELTALDQQLEILEKSLAPVQAWSTQFSAIQRSLTHSLLHAVDPERASGTAST